MRKFTNYTNWPRKIPPPLNSQSINIVFKGHPRDKDEAIILSKLKEVISKLYPNEFPTPNDITWLYTLNRKIPFELYMTAGIFQDYPIKNRRVKMFGSFSTIFLMTYDYDLSKNISHFLLNNWDNETINYKFGTNSKLFPESKRIKFL